MSTRSTVVTRLGRVEKEKRKWIIGLLETVSGELAVKGLLARTDGEREANERNKIRAASVLATFLNTPLMYDYILDENFGTRPVLEYFAKRWHVETLHELLHASKYAFRSTYRQDHEPIPLFVELLYKKNQCSVVLVHEEPVSALTLSHQELVQVPFPGVRLQ